MPGGLPDLSALDGTDAAVEIARLRAGEPWCATEVAGAQFYDYGRWDEVLGRRVIPSLGDRLAIVREPENPHDGNACQVWWRNEHMLGHLPRGLAAQVAPLLDAGVPLRAYVDDPGEGDAWELTALLVGPAVGPVHARHIEHVVHEALHGTPERERKAAERARKRGARNASGVRVRRIRRLRAAVETLLKLPFEPELPEIGSVARIRDLEAALACSDSTVGRLVRGTGQECGRYTHRVEMTPELDEACRAWARAPKSRLSEYQQSTLSNGVPEERGRSVVAYDDWRAPYAG